MQDSMTFDPVGFVAHTVQPNVENGCSCNCGGGCGLGAGQAGGTTIIQSNC